MNRSDIVIVGGGLAGATAAESYRAAGGTGSATIISQDRDLPVHRPPLSKEYLRGDKSREKLFVHPAEFYSENQIEVRLGTGVDDLDLAQKQLVLADGDRFGFSTLVLASGARPRRLTLPGGDLPGVFYLRSLGSAERLQRAYRDAERAVIIGAGFIGMEVAATLTQRGVACTIVEMAPSMWSRIVPPVVADHIRSLYEANGVEFRFGVGIGALEGEERLSRVVLESGETLPADLVVAGVGAALNTALAEDAGLATDRGVVVDEYLRTAHPDVYAMGDIASFPDPVAGRMHLEHWDNALNQGRAMGKTLAGQPAPFDHVAYFFSDMFDLSLNMVGYPAGWDDIIVRGDPGSGEFTTVYITDGQVRAAAMLNDDTYFDEWTALVRAKARADAEGLSDPATDPRTVVSLTLT